jgi:hypothetical protein
LGRQKGWKGPVASWQAGNAPPVGLGSFALSAVVVAAVDWAAIGLEVSVTRIAVGSEVAAVESRFSVDWAAEEGVLDAALAVVEVVPELRDVVDASDA